MEPTALDQIIAFLLSARSTRIYRQILWSRVRERQKNFSHKAFNQHIYRLRKKGIIESKGKNIYVCEADLIKFVVANNAVMKNVFPKGPEKVLISFDIPETKKKVRDWLRNQIKYWEFEMIHKSLWLGKGPLPKEFNNRLKLLNIDKNVRIFKVAKRG